MRKGEEMSNKTDITLKTIDKLKIKTKPILDVSPVEYSEICATINSLIEIIKDLHS
jgi:hypothetical protein